MEKDVLIKQEKKYIYLLNETKGQYDEMYTHAIRAYYDKEEAEKECEKLTKYYEELYAEYHSIDFDVNETKHAAFMEFLKERNPEEYTRAEKAFYDDANGGPLCGPFDFNKFYDKEYEFFDTPELYDYLRKTGCTERDIHLIEVEKEVSDELGYDFPSYHVSEPIELS